MKGHPFSSTTSALPTYGVLRTCCLSPDAWSKATTHCFKLCKKQLKSGNFKHLSTWRLCIGRSRRYQCDKERLPLLFAYQQQYYDPVGKIASFRQNQIKETNFLLSIHISTEDFLICPILNSLPGKGVCGFCAVCVCSIPSSIYISTQWKTVKPPVNGCGWSTLLRARGILEKIFHQPLRSWAERVNQHEGGEQVWGDFRRNQHSSRLRNDTILNFLSIDF